MKNNRPNFMPVTMLSLAVLTGIIFSSRISSAQDRDQLQAVWQKKVREESKQFFNWFKSHATGSISTNTIKVLLNGEQQTIKNQQVRKRKGSFYILRSEPFNANPMAGGSSCYGINSKYAFNLKKAKNGKDWVVQSIVEATPDFDDKKLGVNMSGVDAATGEKIEGFRGSVNHCFNRNFLAVRLIAENGVLGYPSPLDPWNVEELPGFLLHSISTDGQGQERIRLNFDYQVEDSKREKIGVANCHVDFVLEPICHPVKSHQVMKNGDEETNLDWSNEVKKNSEREYEVKYFSRLEKTKNAVVTKSVESQEETTFSLDDPPESDFTLSAFGLPEPPGIEWKKPFPWYLVFASTGTACLGVFFFLRARGRRLRGS